MEMKAETVGALGVEKFVEKTVEHLSIFTPCKIAKTGVPYAYKQGVKPKGGANMATATKQTEGKEELLQQDTVHSFLIKEIIRIMERNQNEVFLRGLLTRARNMEDILNKI